MNLSAKIENIFRRRMNFIGQVYLGVLRAAEKKGLRSWDGEEDYDTFLKRKEFLDDARYCYIRSKRGWFVLPKSAFGSGFVLDSYCGIGTGSTGLLWRFRFCRRVLGKL